MGCGSSTASNEPVFSLNFGMSLENASILAARPASPAIFRLQLLRT